MNKQAILFPSAIGKTGTFNGSFVSLPIAPARKWTEAKQARFEVKAAAAGPAEISINGYIGQDYWDESATSEQQFLNALKGLSNDQELIVRVNSQGGSVKDGLGIYNAIKRRQGKTTAHITGFACSIASVIPLACDQVISPKSSAWMIHDPLCMTAGNSEDHQKSIEMLETCAATMAAIYSEDRKSTRLNSSHGYISYAVFCLK